MVVLMHGAKDPYNFIRSTARESRVFEPLNFSPEERWICGVFTQPRYLHPVRQVCVIFGNPHHPIPAR
jgi:hypothetical protein